MKSKLLLILFTALIFAACGDKKEEVPAENQGMNEAQKVEVQKKAQNIFGALPDKMPGSEADTPELISLGKKLYFETKLSVNNTQSCNTCHLVDNGKAGVDNLPVSPGALGEDGTRNSPTVINAGFQFLQFWDGREPDLKAQAKGPILNPIEMAMKSEADVEKVLKADEEYQKMFKEAFKEDNSITYDNMAHAIAAFERTLISKSRFDDYCNGDLAALTDEETKGLQTFMDVGCITCHTGPLVGGNMFQKMGLVRPYESEDKGKFEVTKNEADKMMFKVPMLRNVVLTHPYYHDGSVKDLKDAIKQMAVYNLGKDLTQEQTDEIYTFLNALTGKEFEKK